MSYHYSYADIREWEITTVVTVKMLAFDVETLEVRIINEGLATIHMNGLMIGYLNNESQQTIEFILLKTEP